MNANIILVSTGKVDVERVLRETGQERSLVRLCGDEDELRIALKELGSASPDRPVYFTMKTRQGVMVWPLSEVIYCRNQDHRVSVYLADGTCVTSVTQRIPFLDVVRTLMLNGFVQTNQSCVVNPAFVVQFRATRLQLSNGVELPISRLMRETVYAALGG